MGFHLAQADVILAEAGDQNLDQAPFAGLEIAEQQVTAFAVNINDLSGTHGLILYSFLGLI